MSCRMIQKISFKREGFLADITLVWLIARMPYHVTGEVMLLGKAFTALFASKGFVTGVDAFMAFEMARQAKSLLTITAHEWFFANVYQVMLV